MLDPKKQAEYEQGTAALIEMLPPLWRGLYIGCVEQGFTGQDALDLVRTYIMSQRV